MEHQVLKAVGGEEILCRVIAYQVRRERMAAIAIWDCQSKTDVAHFYTLLPTTRLLQFRCERPEAKADDVKTQDPGMTILINKGTIK